MIILLRITFLQTDLFYNPKTGTQFSGITPRIGGTMPKTNFWNPTGGPWGITPGLSLKTIPYYGGLMGIDLYNQTQIAPYSSTTTYTDDVFYNPYENSLMNRYRTNNPNSILNVDNIDEYDLNNLNVDEKNNRSTK